MYHRYFGLQEEPFSIAPNPAYLYMGERHKEALAHLLYGVNGSGGFVMLTGEVGTGKTTISRCLLEQLPDNTDVAFILNPFLNAKELLATICDEFNLLVRDSASLKHLTEQLYHFLLNNHARGCNTVLIIDEAQHLQFEVLEKIRLLTNLETDTKKLLQIIFIGQPELRELLAKPALRQLAQRITARFHIDPLTLAETRAYINHRLKVAGLPANQELFPASIVKAIHKKTGGIPRLINILCDRTLLGAYAQNTSKVDKAIYAKAAKEAIGDHVYQHDSSAVTARVNHGVYKWAVLASGIVLVCIAMLAWRLPELAERIAAIPVITPLKTQQTESEQTDTQQVKMLPAEIEPLQELAKKSGALNAANGFADEGQALNEILRLAQLVDKGTRQPCVDITMLGLRCESRVAATWQQFVRLNRPAVLELFDSLSKETVYAPVVGVTDTHARISISDSVHLMSLMELGEQWTGRFVFFWQPPEFFKRPVALGDRADIVAWTAKKFSELDRQEAPLAEKKFNKALHERVKHFQRENLIKDDGIIGTITLLKLNEILGIAKITLNDMPLVRSAQNDKG